MDIKELETWFQERPRWLQDAARRLVQNGDLAEKDYAELFNMCKGEVLGQSPTFSPLPAGSLSFQDTTKPLRLKSIAHVQGINALSPTKPLEFGQEQLCIVYGRNGTGKSGYVRLLKHACGARHLGQLEGDIFRDGQEPQSARFTFSDGAMTKDAQWSDAPIPDLEGIDIYDTTSGLIYVNEENEVTFEPLLLRLFTRLTDSCTSLSNRINDRISGLVSKKPDLPAEFAKTNAGAWYQGLSAAITSKSVDEETAWTPAFEEELGELKKRLAEANPAAKAGSLRRRKEAVLELRKDLQSRLEGLSKERCEKYVGAKTDAGNKRKAADQDARKIFENCPLGRVGSESWRLMWNAARRYSEEAYPGTQFPNVADDARCVLCQQPLDGQARARLVSFEEFVKAELQRLATEAEQTVREMENSLPEALTSSALNTKMGAAGIEDAAIRTQIGDFNSTLAKRRQSCLAAEKKEEISPDPPLPDVVALLDGIAMQTEREAVACDEDAKGQNRPELDKRAKELSLRRWLNQQRNAIDEEITRLGAVVVLNEMDKLTNTHALSTRKGKLAEELITEAYIRRFQAELNQLQGARIKVELKKTKSVVGRVYHRIALSNAKKKVKTSEILSEGEFRIVSLAAFLADAEGRGAKTPFIFDDPISSLDLEYEEATAQRLVRLSTARQVIVFTHRLSLIGFLEKYAKKYNLKPSLICLSDYKIGDVSELPINLKKTDSTVNELLNKHLPQAKKAFDEGDAAYEKEASAMCRNIRILLERVVEKDLLNEVVRRFNPEVQTKDKIHALARITDGDCKFIDEYMTKYSRYEHSQPEEAAIKLPPPDEIERDLNAVTEFIKEIKGRKEQ